VLWQHVFQVVVCVLSAVQRAARHSVHTVHANLMTYTSANVQWKTPDDGQRNCPKHVEFPDKNKFGKISASVGFVTRKRGRYLIWQRDPEDEGATFLRHISNCLSVDKALHSTESVSSARPLWEPHIEFCVSSDLTISFNVVFHSVVRWAFPLDSCNIFSKHFLLDPTGT